MPTHSVEILRSNEMLGWEMSYRLESGLVKKRLHLTRCLTGLIPCYHLFDSFLDDIPQWTGYATFHACPSESQRRY